MQRVSHNHGLDPSCNEHPTGDCIIQELLDRLEAAERDLAAVTVSRDGWKPRAEAAEKKVAAVRELHAKEKHGVQHHCGECLQDDNTGSWDYVEWPCATITALDGVPNA